uniref:Uncharacterized protein n=1 Tax=Oryza barthii TaxID=65489 RepID=A0A0D3GZ02_9ORYZ
MARRRVSAGAASTPIHQIDIQGRTTKALHGCSIVIKSSTSVVGPYAWVNTTEEAAAALGTNPLLSFPLDAGGGRGADGRGGTDSTSRSPPRSGQKKGASRQWRQRRRSPRPRAAAPDRGCLNAGIVRTTRAQRHTHRRYTRASGGALLAGAPAPACHYASAEEGGGRLVSLSSSDGCP